MWSSSQIGVPKRNKRFYWNENQSTEKKKWKIEKQLTKLWAFKKCQLNRSDLNILWASHWQTKCQNCTRISAHHQRKTHNTSQTRQPRSSNQTRSHPSKSHKPHNSNNYNNNCNSNNTVSSSVQALVRFNWCLFIASPLQNATSRDDHFHPGGRGEGEQRQADDIITRLVSVCVLCVLSHFSFCFSFSALWSGCGASLQPNVGPAGLCRHAE